MPLPAPPRQSFLDWLQGVGCFGRTPAEKGGSVAGFLSAAATAQPSLLRPALILEPFSFLCPSPPQKKESVSVLPGLAERHNLTW